MEALAATPPLAPAFSAEEAELAGVIPARARVDIIVRRQAFKHEEYYVLKDPLALTYYRLKPEEAYVLSLLDGKRSLLEIQRRFNARHPHETRSLRELATFINQLSAGGLLNQNAGRFVENVRRTATQGLLQVWAKLIGAAFFLKIPLVDPSPWLGKLTHAMRFAWTKWFVGGALLLMLASLGRVVANADAFSAGVLDFFSAGNMALLYVAIIITKTLHEFGHATTCRHFGGEVHEMGVCLMFFTPCGYVDASDAWMMRHKRHKLFVTISGIFTELIIASCAAHLFLALPEGLMRGVAFNVMLVASVNTLIFNANPLMRFDGYYLLCDWLEIPNLRTKAIAYCSFHLQRLLLGYRNRQQEEAFIHDARARVFVLYAVAAYGYMIFIIYGVTQIFANMLAPYGLHDFGLSLGIFVEASFVALPILKVIHDVMKPGAHVEKTGSAPRRLLVLAAALALAVAAAFFIPARYHVEQQAVVMAARGEWAASETGGIVREVRVRTGQWVEPGEVLAVLSNPEVETELAVAAVELAEAKVLFAASERPVGLGRAEDPARYAQGLEVAEATHRRAAARAARLRITAGVAGHVLSANLERLVGVHAPPQQPLLRIGDMRSVRLVIPLTEDQVQLVEPGGRVTGRWLASGRSFETTLDGVSSQPARQDEMHFGMLSYFGGPAPSQVLQAQAHFHFPLFLAGASLENPGQQLFEGVRARVAIEGRRTTVAGRIKHWLYSLFQVGGGTVQSS